MWEAQLRDVQVLPFLRRQHSAWANFAKDPSSGVGRWNYQVLGLDTLNTWGFIERTVHIFEHISQSQWSLPKWLKINASGIPSKFRILLRPGWVKVAWAWASVCVREHWKTTGGAEICMGLRHVRTFSGNSWLIHPNFQRLVVSRCAKASCTEPTIAAATLGMSLSRSWSILNEPSPEVAVAPGSSTGCRCFTHLYPPRG